MEGTSFLLVELLFKTLSYRFKKKLESKKFIFLKTLLKIGQLFSYLRSVHFVKIFIAKILL